MKTYISTILIAAVSLALSGFNWPQDWPQFRGWGGVSATDAVLPVEFDDEKNVAWKVELPGRGPASPIVVGDQVIVSSSGGDKEDQLYVSSYDINSGKRLWEQRLWATGRTLFHPTSGNAAPTPASDGKYVYSFYSSNDLCCLDLEGNLIWFRGLSVDYPTAFNDVGMSSSVAVADGIVIAQVENSGESFAMGLNCETGETVWKIDRKKDASWASPIVFQEPGGRWMVTLQSSDCFTVNDVRTGEEVSRVDGECSTISSASMIDDKVYVPLDGTTAFTVSSGGKVEKAWQANNIMSRTASTIIHKEKVYTLGRGGVLAVFSAEDGKPQGKVRVGGTYWGTPAIAGEHMYFFAQDGTARVVKLGEEMEVVHEHQFEDETFLCSPAVTEAGLFVRSDKHLWKISSGDK